MVSPVGRFQKYRKAQSDMDAMLGAGHLKPEVLLYHFRSRSGIGSRGGLKKAPVMLNRARNLKTDPYLAVYAERIECAAGLVVVTSQQRRQRRGVAALTPPGDGVPALFGLLQWEVIKSHFISGALSPL